MAVLERESTEQQSVYVSCTDVLITPQCSTDCESADLTNIQFVDKIR